MRSIGFTGTRHGMTRTQKEGVLHALWEFCPDHFHHGACIGADFQAAQLVEMFSSEVGERIEQHIHLGVSAKDPENHSNRADICLHPDTQFVLYPEKTYLARNRDIVHACGLLIATPDVKPLREEGGTAYTVNYARKLGRPILILWPDGTYAQENMS